MAVPLSPRYRNNFLADNNLSPEMIFAVTSDGRYTQSYGNTTFLVHAFCGGGSSDPWQVPGSAVGISDGSCWWGFILRPEAFNRYAAGDTGRASFFFTVARTPAVDCLEGCFSEGIAGPKYANFTSTGAPGSDPNGYFVDTSASALPFSPTDKAVVGTSGTSHSWGVSMEAGVAPLNLAAGNPNNKYGLKTAAEVTDSALQTRLQGAGNKVSCSVCHDQHTQANATWNPYAAPALSGAKQESGAATRGGMTTAINDTAKSWTSNGWVGYYVRILMGNSANLGHVAQITANTASQLAVPPAFPATIAVGDKYENHGKGFMRTRNDLDQLCVACHAYRVPTSVPTGGVSQTDVRTWDGNVKSHPINKVFTATAQPNESVVIDDGVMSVSQ